MHVLGVVVVALLASGCAGSEADPDVRTEVPAQVEGVVVEVDSEGLGEVRAFTLKDGDRLYEVAIDPVIDYGFNLDHLQEHVATADPVVVELEQRDDELVATAIDDA